MTRYRTVVLLSVLLGLFSLSGAQCNFLAPREDPIARLPPALPPSPTLQQVIAVVNNNSTRIQSFSTSQASLSMQGFPALRANIAFQRPMRLRLRADLPIAGQEVDAGSNDELFWFWARRNEPAALYYCRHDQFAASPVRRNLAIDPSWLIEALGLAQLDPALPHQGPRVRPDGGLEIRTSLSTPQGPATKITILDPRQALILAQYLYDARNQLAASAVAGRYRQDPLTGLFMPTVVEIQTAAVQGSTPLKLRIDQGPVEITRPIPNVHQLWIWPTIPGWPVVDLCNPAARASPATTLATPPAYSATPPAYPLTPPATPGTPAPGAALLPIGPG
jgi:hypothetical protein